VLATPTIVHTPARHIAVIRLTVPWNKIEFLMEPGLNELIATVSAQGIGPTGPWFNRHLRVQPNIVDVEIGVPVSSPVVPVGRVERREVPVMTMARALYHGSYEGLGTAWRDFNAWIRSKGHGTGPDFYECYVVGPDANPDPTAWRTELTRQLTGLGEVVGHG
jgi:effector-binding domain-containing protein